MHSSQIAVESLEAIWRNHLVVKQSFDLDTFSSEELEIHAKSLVRPFNIAMFHARQGTFIAMWNLWEFYSRSILEGLPQTSKKSLREATPDWIGRSLEANGLTFSQQDWFSNANPLRNLIAHNGARIDSARSDKMHKRANLAFSSLRVLSDGYVAIEHVHVAELKHQIDCFIYHVYQQLKHS